MVIRGLEFGAMGGFGGPDGMRTEGTGNFGHEGLHLVKKELVRLVVYVCGGLVPLDTLWSMQSAHRTQVGVAPFSHF